jgi:hypothetical protein
MLQVACSRCERRGRYQLDTLITRSDADGAARIFVPELTADCRQRDTAALTEKCNILFPELLKLFQRRSILCVSNPGAWAS